MERKKILFTCLRMNVGGVEKSMLSLIDALGKYVDAEGRTGRQLFDIHLALMAPEGGFMGNVPDWVTVHPIGGFAFQQELWRPPIKGIIKRLATLRWRSGLPAAWYFAKSQLTKSLFPYIKWLLRNDRPGGRYANEVLDGEFDLAIDFPGLPGEYLGYYVAHHIKARRRASWVHFDLDQVFIRPKSAAAIYARMDRVYAVSEQAAERFRLRWPREMGKVRIFHNIVNCDSVVAQSKEKISVADGRVNIVTVGRTSYEKGQDRAIRALHRLIQQGHTNFDWHFIGGGDQLENNRALAASLGIADHCHFYGAKSNPYPYMRMADIYVQPSRHEGYCITIAEAKCFGMPIVATDFVGASEQLSAIENAIVIPNHSEADADSATFAEAILRAVKLPKISPGNLSATNSEMEDFLQLLK